MDTTVEIPEETLKRAMTVARSASAKEVVVRALEEFSKRHDQADLVALLGTSEGFYSAEELDELRRMD